MAKQKPVPLVVHCLPKSPVNRRLMQGDAHPENKSCKIRHPGALGGENHEEAKGSQGKTNTDGCPNPNPIRQKPGGYWTDPGDAEEKAKC
jgi:hypothetical protein